MLNHSHLLAHQNGHLNWSPLLVTLLVVILGVLVLAL